MYIRGKTTSLNTCIDIIWKFYIPRDGSDGKFPSSCELCHRHVLLRNVLPTEIKHGNCRVSSDLLFGLLVCTLSLHVHFEKLITKSFFADLWFFFFVIKTIILKQFRSDHFRINYTIPGPKEIFYKFPFLRMQSNQEFNTKWLYQKI